MKTRVSFEYEVTNASDLAVQLRADADKLEASAGTSKRGRKSPSKSKPSDEDDESETDAEDTDAEDTDDESDDSGDEGDSDGDSDDAEEEADEDGGDSEGGDESHEDEGPSKVDVIKACRVHSKKNGRPATLAVLKKKFGVSDVNKLKASKYPALITALK